MTTNENKQGRFFSMLSPPGMQGKLTILVFHKLPVAADPLTPDELSFAQFQRMLDYVEDNGTVIDLPTAILAAERGTLPRCAVALTFDDGYAEWVTHVAPELRRRNMPATFFVSTEQLDGPVLWHERIIAAVRALPDRGASLPYAFGRFKDLSSLDKRIALVAALQHRLKYVPLQERLAAIEMIEAQAERPLVLPDRFDAESVRNLHAQGFDIGGHTITHPILNECLPAEAREEIGGCREQLQAITRAPVRLFAYPNGRPRRDFNAEHIRMARSCGYDAAVITGGGAASTTTDRFQLPRFTPWSAGRVRLTYQFCRNIIVPAPIRPLPARTAIHAGAPSVRCLLIAGTFPPVHGGSAVVYDNLCRHMPAGSVRVLTNRINYLTHKEIEGWRESDAQAGFPVHRIHLLRQVMMPAPANRFVSLCRAIFQDLWLYLRILVAASFIVYRHRINVVCVGELVTNTWLGLALRKLFGCKVVIYVHGEEITQETAGLHGSRRRQYLHAADKVVAVSSFTCDALTHQMGLSPDDIVLIENGVDTDKFTPGERDESLIARHRLAGKKIVLTVGRLVPRKGMDMGIAAMAQVVKQRTDVHYLIVGDGEYRPQLEKMIDELELREYVTLVGKVSDAELVQYFRTCDLFLMPNRTMPDGDTEGFGLVFREANACGKPAIGGRAGGAVEAVIDGETGFLVDGTEPRQIATAVLTLLDNESLARRMSETGLRVARENNTRAVSQRFLKACERLLRGA